MHRMVRTKPGHYEYISFVPRAIWYHDATETGEIPRRRRPPTTRWRKHGATWNYSPIWISEEVGTHRCMLNLENSLRSLQVGLVFFTSVNSPCPLSFSQTCFVDCSFFYRLRSLPIISRSGSFAVLLFSRSGSFAVLFSRSGSFAVLILQSLGLINRVNILKTSTDVVYSSVQIE